MGDSVTVDVGPVAHGGHCVARHEGRVIFVRHALPGERVTVVVTEVGPKGRYLRADVQEVLTSSPSRIKPPCRYAGVCGGCDWQHADVAYQRTLKARVVAEQLSRLAGQQWDGEVEEVGMLPDGLRWRTRVGFTVDPQGNLGLLRHRSHTVQPIDECLIAHPAVTDAVTNAVTNAANDARAAWHPGDRVEVAVSVATGEVSLSIGKERPQTLHEQAAGRTWQVTGGFWQVHPAAAVVLVQTVQGQIKPSLGEHVVDLYSGVGLFAGALAADVGPGGRVDAVEAAASAVGDARANLADQEHIHIHHSDVLRFLKHTGLRRCDLVVLDPPRSGAGRQVLDRVTRLRPRAISYVACDPAALARDVALLADLGYALIEVRAFDLFPMTHHVECVAHFERVM